MTYLLQIYNFLYTIFNFLKEYIFANHLELILLGAFLVAVIFYKFSRHLIMTDIVFMAIIIYGFFYGIIPLWIVILLFFIMIVMVMYIVYD